MSPRASYGQSGSTRGQQFRVAAVVAINIIWIVWQHDPRIGKQLKWAMGSG
jgi:hypothetical protein